MDTQQLSAEQSAMEKRFELPYNWCRGVHTRNWRQKNGLWTLVKETVGSLSGLTVLDAGCGDGWYSARMVAENAKVSGADYSERAVRLAQAIVPDASFVAASILEMPYADETFDLSFSFQVIEHLPIDQVPLAIKELMRVTKKGGRVVVSVPSTLRPLSRAHYQHFTERMLRDLFESHADTMTVIGQDRHTRGLSILERLIENRLYTLERIGSRFNRTTYLRSFNTTTPDKGYNLVIVAERR